MKLWIIAVLVAALAPLTAYAQDVEELELEEIRESFSQDQFPSIKIYSDSDKLNYIISKVNRMNVGITHITEDDAGVDAFENTGMEAIIHSEGVDAIRKYHSAVRSRMKDNEAWTNIEVMLLTIHEIRMLSRHMQWKAMRSHLISLDRYSADNFPIWNEMRVEGWLVQAETMLYLRPEGDERKRAIEGLLAKVKLAQKTNDSLEYDFTISDRIIDIEEGKIPLLAMMALEDSTDTALQMEEAGKKEGFFGNLAKKLKFW